MIRTSQKRSQQVLLLGDPRVQNADQIGHFLESVALLVVGRGLLVRDFLELLASFTKPSDALLDF